MIRIEESQIPEIAESYRLVIMRWLSSLDVNDISDDFQEYFHFVVMSIPECLRLINEYGLDRCLENSRLIDIWDCDEKIKENDNCCREIMRASVAIYAIKPMRAVFLLASGQAFEAIKALEYFGLQRRISYEEIRDLTGDWLPEYQPEKIDYMND